MNVELVKSKKIVSMLGNFAVEAIGLVMTISPYLTPYLTTYLGEGSIVVQLIGLVVLFGGSQYFQRFRAFVAQNWGITNYVNGNLSDIQNLPEDAEEYYDENIGISEDGNVDTYTGSESEVVGTEKQ